MRGKLLVVGTPIGNVDDLSPRARSALATASIIAAEDTRRARGLLSRIGLNPRIIAYHEHNEEQRLPELLAALERDTVALISDAGTPLISDPGWRLVRAVRGAGIEIVAVPGPCAAIVALMAVGLPTDHFVFEGFLPRREGARAQRLSELATDSRTIVIYEAVHRLPATLNALVVAFGGDRPAAVARELTKTHEQIRVATLSELEHALGHDIPLLGEFVIVVGGCKETLSGSELEARRVYDLLAAEVTPERALRLTSTITGWSRNDLYRLVRT